MVEISNLNQYYGSSHILWDVNFRVKQGSCTCLLGRNGVGKTTLLQCIMGLLPVRDGQIFYKQEDLLRQSVETRASSGIAYVPQGRQIFPLLTVEENIRTGLLARGANHRDIPAVAYELFPVLKTMRSRRGGDLSGGQQQQLAIARALVLEPEFLILDEPAEGIQPSIVQEIGEVIQTLNQDRGITMLLVEQKLPFARKVGSHYVLMERGRVASSGDMADISDDLVNQYLSV